MKSKAAITLLALAVFVFAAGWGLRHLVATRHARVYEERLHSLSNQVADVTGKLFEQTKVNLVLTNQVFEARVELEKAKEALALVSSNLVQAEAETKIIARAAQDEIARRDVRIEELSRQNEALERRAAALRESITALEAKIAETERRLEAAEGDREFLLKELKRMQDEKADLERRFNDVIALREQLAIIREQTVVARRLEWLRKGIYGSGWVKGAERLQSGFGPRTRSAPSRTPDLNVELHEGRPANGVAPTNTVPVAPPPSASVLPAEPAPAVLPPGRPEPAPIPLVVPTNAPADGLAVPAALEVRETVPAAVPPTNAPPGPVPVPAPSP